MAGGLSDLMAKLNITTEPDAFLKWFWEGTNGNELIRELNSYAQKNELDDRIRREKDCPNVYAIVLNNFSIGRDEEWKLVKVGLTHKSIKRNSNNRMEQLQKIIESKLNKDSNRAATASKSEVKASILFAVRIGSVDTTPFHDTEARIRGKVGTPIKTAKAKEQNLHAPTEWVLTTQSQIKEILERLNDKKAESGSAEDLIDVFKDINPPQVPPNKFPDWVEEEKCERRKKTELNNCHE